MMLCIPAIGFNSMLIPQFAQSLSSPIFLYFLNLHFSSFVDVVAMWMGFSIFAWILDHLFTYIDHSHKFFVPWLSVSDGGSRFEDWTSSIARSETT